MENSVGIISNINDTFTKVFSSIGKDIFKLLDKLLYINMDIFKDTILSKKDIIDGITVISNSLILAFLIYYIFQMVTSMYSGREVQNTWSFVLRMIVCIILMNNSYFICTELVNIFDILTDLLVSLGKEVFGLDISFEQIYQKISKLKQDENDYLSLNGIIKGMLQFGSISLAISYAVRYVQVQILVILSPFAFLTLLSKNTTGIFKSWLKLFTMLMALQLVSTIILYIPMGIEINDSLFSKVIFLGSIYTLYKANGLVKELIGVIGTYSDANNGISGLKTIFR